MAMLSILGLYNYDDTIFDDLTIPEDDDGNALLDSAELIETICFQNAELELLYTEPATVKSMIGMWSTSSQYSWKKMAETLNLDYNPIWNKDGTITETESRESSGEASGTNVNQVSAYNATTFQNRDQSTSDSDSSATEERSYTRVEQGNIGVTSTQQLVREEREVAAFNIYDWISNDFKNRFCLQIY